MGPHNNYVFIVFFVRLATMGSIITGVGSLKTSFLITAVLLIMIDSDDPIGTLVQAEKLVSCWRSIVSS